MRLRLNGRCTATVLLTALSAAFQGQLYSQEINPSESPRKDHRMIEASGLTAGAGNGIFYHSGPVMLGTPNIYLIWYGSWTPVSKLILTNLASNLGGSPYLQINSTYYDSANRFVTGNAALAGQTTDAYSQGKNLSDAQIQTIVTNAIVPSGSLPLDPQGVYFVMTWTDVTATSGFCTQYCGWHTEATIKGQPIKYAFIGNAAVKCPNSCTAQSVSPNNDQGADGAASVFSHELEESITDPNLNAWYDNNGNENADKCAWTFGTMYTTSNGAKANVKLGGMDYLIQQNWVNSGGGFCAMSYNNTAPVLASVTPNSAVQGTATNVTVTGSNFIAGSTVSVSGLGITAGNVTVVSATQITATLTVAANAAIGGHNLTVTTSNGTSGPVTFNVAAAAPTLSAIAPAAGSQGTTVNVTLSGTNFVAGSTVAVSGTGVSAGSVTVVSATQINASLTVAASAATGARTVTVSGTNGASNGVTFTVNAASNPAPTVSSLTPNSGTQGSSVNVTLTGTNFLAGSTLAVSGTGVTAANVTVVTATQITATLTIAAGSATGSRSVSVTNANGTSNAVGFTVNATGGGVPTLTSITPNNGARGTSVQVTLIGTNFNQSALIGFSGVDNVATNLVVVSPTQIDVTLNLPATATVGAHNMKVVTSGGYSNILPFTIH